MTFGQSLRTTIFALIMRAGNTTAANLVKREIKLERSTSERS
jgi:hypothetical protein